MGSNLNEVLGFFQLPNSSIRTMALELTQPLAEMRTSNLPWGSSAPVPKTDNIAICGPIV
jgi:hypothetical protein